MTSPYRKFLSLLTLLLVLPVGVAQAHNLNVFAISDGEVIEGYVYFTGGTRARNATVTLKDGSETDLLTTTADSDGSFALRVSHRTDYAVFADTGDGHIANFALPKTEFLETLPEATDGDAITVTALHDAAPLADAAPTIAPTSTDEDSDAVSGNVAGNNIGIKGLSEGDLTALINRAVARQVGPLRAEINAYRNDVRMSDILGGIGIIIGIFGVGAWVVAHRQSKA